MDYDLRKTNKESRKKFVKYANRLLKNERCHVQIIDLSDRTLNQNSYLHILCRILAMETGVTERYAKDMYFKRLANPGIFIQKVQDPLTKQEEEYIKSTKDLTVTEMSKAINTFRMWSEQNGYYLPDADIDYVGEVTPKTDKDREALLQAEMSNPDDIYI